MNLDLRSALVGAGVFGLLAVAIAWQNPTQREVVQIPAPATALGGPLQIDGIPTPDQLIRLSKLDGDLPYLVPADKWLVITDYSWSQNCCDAAYVAENFNGISTIKFRPSETTVPVRDAPLGYAFRPGSFVDLVPIGSVQVNNVGFTLVGYLQDA